MAGITRSAHEGPLFRAVGAGQARHAHGPAPRTVSPGGALEAKRSAPQGRMPRGARVALRAARGIAECPRRTPWAAGFTEGCTEGAYGTVQAQIGCYEACAWVVGTSWAELGRSCTCVAHKSPRWGLRAVGAALRGSEATPRAHRAGGRAFGRGNRARLTINGRPGTCGTVSSLGAWHARLRCLLEKVTHGTMTVGNTLSIRHERV